MSAEETGNLQAGVKDEEETEEVIAPVEDTEAGPDLIIETEETEEKPAKEVEEKPTPEQTWDRERQERDQRHAADRKELQGKIGDLTERLAANDGRIEAILAKAEAADKTAETKPVTDLSPDSEVEEIVGALNKQVAAGQQLQEQIAGLQTQLAERDNKQAERDVKTENARAEAEYKSLVTGLEKGYGEKYSAEAQKRTQSYFQERGYDEENGPSDVALELALDRFFKEVKAEDKTGAPKPTSEPSVTLDTGTGGAKTTPPQRPMTDTEFRAKARKAGLDV